MPIVFEVYKPTGSLHIDLSSRLTRTIGTISTTYGTPGSIQDDRLKEGTIWYAVLCSFNPGPGRGDIPPKVTKDAATGTISWTTGTGAAATTPVYITYGIYTNGVN